MGESPQVGVVGLHITWCAFYAEFVSQFGVYATLILMGAGRPLFLAHWASSSHLRFPPGSRSKWAA